MVLAKCAGDDNVSADTLATAMTEELGLGAVRWVALGTCSAKAVRVVGKVGWATIGWATSGGFSVEAVSVAKHSRGQLALRLFETSQVRGKARLKPVARGCGVDSGERSLINELDMVAGKDTSPALPILPNPPALFMPEYVDKGLAFVQVQLIVRCSLISALDFGTPQQAAIIGIMVCIVGWKIMGSIHIALEMAETG